MRVKKSYSVYLSEAELHDAIIEYIESRNEHLGSLLDQHDLTMDWVTENDVTHFGIMVDGEIDADDFDDSVGLPDL